MQDRRVLIIEDDPTICKILMQVFSEAGCQVFIATDGLEGLRQFHTHHPDLTILDLMLPFLDGWEVCRRIRQLSDSPLILVTALGSEADIIRGLESGADDYLTKPVSPSILLARAQAVLRRRALPAVTNQRPAYADDYLSIDLVERRILVQGKPIKLSVTEYRLLAYLVQNADQVLTFQQILAKVWGEMYEHNVEYVHVYISRLRRKLEEDPTRPIYLTTEHSVGYRFETQLPLPIYGSSHLSRLNGHQN